MANATNMVFSEATNKTGMYELFQDLCSVNSTSYTAYKYARDANNALADYFMIAMQHSGTWQVDDTNQSDYPEGKAVPRAFLARREVLPRSCEESCP